MFEKGICFCISPTVLSFFTLTIVVLIVQLWFNRNLKNKKRPPESSELSESREASDADDDNDDDENNKNKCKITNKEFADKFGQALGMLIDSMQSSKNN